MNSKLLLSLALVFALGLPHAEARGRGGHGGHKGGFGGGHRMLKDLDLTKEQREKVQALRKANRDKSKAIRAKMKDARKAMFEKMKDAKASDADIRKTFEVVSGYRNEMQRLHFEETLEIRKILTPEQRVKLANKVTEKIENLRERIQEMEEFSPED
ncbi:MAG: Spy/CpxP family protein refolding chaperone [Bdellovibrionota bacterium]